MTKEQEEAIERLKALIKELKIDTVIGFRISADSRTGMANDIETVLSMLKEKDEEIKQLKIAYKLMENEAMRDRKTELEKKNKIIDEIY